MCHFVKSRLFCCAFQALAWSSSSPPHASFPALPGWSSNGLHRFHPPTLSVTSHYTILLLCSITSNKLTLTIGTVWHVASHLLELELEGQKTVKKVKTKNVLEKMEMEWKKQWMEKTVMRENVLNFENHHLDIHFSFICLQPHPWPNPKKCCPVPLSQCQILWDGHPAIAFNIFVLKKPHTAKQQERNSTFNWKTQRWGWE